MLTVGPTYVLMDELAETYERLVGGNAVDAFKMTQGRATMVQQLERDVHRLTTLARGTPAVAEGLQSGTITTLDELRARPWRSRAGGRDRTVPRRPIATSATPARTCAISRGATTRHSCWRRSDADRRCPSRTPTNGTSVSSRRARRSRSAHARSCATVRRTSRSLEEVLATARAVGPLTEEHNYWLDRQVQSIVGRMFRLIGRRLADAGRIERAESVFHFELAEVVAALRDGRDLRPMEAARTAEFARWSGCAHRSRIGAAAPPLGATGSIRTDLIHRSRQDEERRAQRCCGVGRRATR